MFELERHLNEEGQTEQERVECLRGQKESEKFQKRNTHSRFVLCILYATLILTPSIDRY